MGDDALDDAFGDRMTVTLAELVADIARAPLANQPGARWRYSMAMAVLGRVVEVASGMPYERFLQERLFGPLGMVDAGFYVPADKLDRFAALYAPDPKGGLALVDSPQDSRIWKQPSVCPLGGDMMVSSADDYMRFAQMLLNGGELDGVRILGRKTVELMTMNHLPLALLPLRFGPFSHFLEGYGFGLGCAVMLDPARAQSLGSAGAYWWFGVWGTSFFIDPREELIGLLMAQVRWSALQTALEFKVLVYQAVVD